MIQPTTLRGQLLAIAVTLTELRECGPSDPLTVTLRRGGQSVRFTFAPEEISAWEADPLGQLSPDDRAILDCLAGVTLLAKQICDRLKLPYSSAVRSRLTPKAPLCRLGLVEHVQGDGYRQTQLARQLLVGEQGEERSQAA